MFEQNDLAMLQILIRSDRTLPAPAVDLVEPVIRSGDQILIGDPKSPGLQSETDLLRHMDPYELGPPGAGELEKEDYASGSDRQKWRAARRRPYVGRFVLEWMYDVPFDLRDGFQTFLQHAEVRIAHLSEPGARYRGTYAVIEPSGGDFGRYRTIWSFRSFAAIGRMVTAVGASNALNGDPREGPYANAGLGWLINRLKFQLNPAGSPPTPFADDSGFRDPAGFSGQEIQQIALRSALLPAN